MKIIIKSEDELARVAGEALHIIANLRKFTILWERLHGVELKERKKYYEEKADELIKRLQIKDHRHVNQIQIKNENTSGSEE